MKVVKRLLRWLISTTIPRDKNGWPIISPKEMTDLQLRCEAMRWRRTASETEPDTMSNHMWSRYYDELSKRGSVDPKKKSEYPDLELFSL